MISNNTAVLYYNSQAYIFCEHDWLYGFPDNKKVLTLL